MFSTSRRPALALFGHHAARQRGAMFSTSPRPRHAPCRATTLLASVEPCSAPAAVPATRPVGPPRCSPAWSHVQNQPSSPPRALSGHHAARQRGAMFSTSRRPALALLGHHAARQRGAMFSTSRRPALALLGHHAARQRGAMFSTSCRPALALFGHHAARQRGAMFSTSCRPALALFGHHAARQRGAMFSTSRRPALRQPMSSWTSLVLNTAPRWRAAWGPGGGCPRKVSADFSLRVNECFDLPPSSAETGKLFRRPLLPLKNLRQSAVDEICVGRQHRYVDASS